MNILWLVCVPAGTALIGSYIYLLVVGMDWLDILPLVVAAFVCILMGMPFHD